MSGIGTGSTTSTDPRAAAAELVSQAKAGLEGAPTLAILFATSQYDTEALASSVSELLAGIPMWGGSSSTGVFRDDGWVTSAGGAASLMLIADRPGAAVVVPVGDDAFAAGKKAAEEVMKQLGGAAPGALLTLAFMGPEEELLRGIASVAPGVPVVGGSASDHSSEGKFQQIANGHAYTNHFALAAIGGPVGVAFTNGYRPTGKKAMVTKATGRTVFELDGRRAMDVYSAWVAKPEAEIGGGALVSFSVQYPLLFRQAGVGYSAHPTNSSADGSMDFGAAMRPGMELELAEASVNGLVAEAGNAVYKATLGVEHPKAILLSHCGGRAIALGDRIREIPAEIAHTAGHLPTVGYLAFGEQGCSEPGSPTHADLSLSALVLG